MYELLQRQDLHSSKIETINNEYYASTMKIYLIRYRQVQKIRLGMPQYGQVLHKMIHVDYIFSTCQLCQITKNESISKIYGLLADVTENSRV
jgi:hypothetical protein